MKSILCPSACPTDNQFMASNSPVNFPRTMAIMAVLLFYAPKANIAAAQVGAFSFRFEIGNCLTERFDTSTGIFTKTLASNLFRPSRPDLVSRTLK